MSQYWEWSGARDARLRRLRVEGATWDAIAADLGTTRWSAIERGRRIGAPRPPPELATAPEDGTRDPLPPGSATSWGAITAGTLLEGAAYPFPVFNENHRNIS